MSQVPQSPKGEVGSGDQMTRGGKGSSGCKRKDKGIISVNIPISMTREEGEREGQIHLVVLLVLMQ